MSDLHEIAAGVIDRVLARRGSARNLALGSSYSNKKQLYAIVCETLKYADHLKSVIESSRILEQARQPWMSLFLVFGYELLIGKGLRKGGGLRKVILDNQEALKLAWNALLQRNGAANAKELLGPQVPAAAALPRYVRVNTIVRSLEDCMKALADAGFQQLQAEPENPASVEAKWLCQDPHVPNLLIVSPNSIRNDHALVQDGSFILQDKASCMPPVALEPQPGDVVIDACSAPGNKTSELAALMANTGRVWAFDRDPQRFLVLKATLDRAQATIVRPVQQDFLKVRPTDEQYRKVSRILVDPSCSGSGIQSRQLLPGESRDMDETRLRRLSDMQFKLVNHALSFPNVQRVVYSTCSIHEIENEEVVARLLAANADFELAHIFPDWSHRGHISACANGDRTVRASPEDRTNGFYVSCFVRKQSQQQLPLIDQSPESRQPPAAVADDCVGEMDTASIPTDVTRSNTAKRPHGESAPVTAVNVADDVSRQAKKRKQKKRIVNRVSITGR
eukprot:TRINITY_DN4560_c0_g1_i1.p1 TRINITY_DN4560_c0_g1~~TRINITY_DN4560_c0_g1_i1.p1  ORF type:complete len:507 (+),score=103.23 TRINITY_DN4560_c0_g1_i1:59-1579(+)